MDFFIIVFRKWPDKVLDFEVDEMKDERWGMAYLASPDGGPSQKWVLNDDYTIQNMYGNGDIFLDVDTVRLDSVLLVGCVQRKKSSVETFLIGTVILLSSSHYPKMRCRSQFYIGTISSLNFNILLL